MQKMGYANKPFINSLLKRSDLNNFWYKWLTKLKDRDQIELPYFENDINTLGKIINIEDVRKFSQAHLY